MRQAPLFAVSISLLLGTGLAAAYSLAPYEQIVTPAAAGSVVVGDLDGDGVNEIAVATEYSSNPDNVARLYIYRFDPLINSFAQVWSMPLPNQYPNRMTMVPARTHTDGGLTLAIGTERTMSIVHWSGQVAQMRTVATPFAMQVVQALDLDGDGLDEVVGQSHSQGAILFKSDGLASVSIIRQFATGPRGFNDATVGDLNADGLNDWAVMSGQLYSAPHVEIFHSSGTGDFSPGSYAFRVESNSNVGGIGAGDINGDGRDDLVLSRPNNSPTWLHVLLQNAAGGFTQSSVPTFDIPSDIAISDLSGDGLAEVLVAHRGWSTLSHYAASPDGLALAQMVTVPYGTFGPTAIATGDVTGDGCADVVLAGGASGVAVLRGLDCAPPVDASPDPINFEPQTSVARGSVITSTATVISGINVPVAVSVSGGEYSINGGIFTSVQGQINQGDLLRLRHTASSNFATGVTTEVVVGGVAGAFTSTTEVADGSPDAFAFTDVTRAARKTWITSNEIVLTGFNVAASISIASDGQYSINGGAFRTSVGTVKVGDRVTLRLRSATQRNTTVSTTVTIGNQSDQWSVTTGS